MHTDVLVVGAGLAGLVATAELAAAGRRVVLLDQESAANLGGQAFWSFGGLFLVDTPEQRRMGISRLLRAGLAGLGGHARGSTAHDEDHWGRRVGARLRRVRRRREARLAARARGVVLPGRRAGPSAATARARGHGNSVPRFHIPWGTGTGVVEPFVRKVREHIAAGRVSVPAPPPGRRARAHRRGAVTGVRGVRARARRLPRPAACRATATWPASSSYGAQAVIVTSGGIGGNHDLVRANWPERLGTPPRRPAHRGAGLRRRPDARHHRGGRRPARQPRPDVALRRGRAQLGPDLARARASASCPARASMWFDARGQPAARAAASRASTPSARSAHLRHTGHDHSWFILNPRDRSSKEFALSGSEQNPDLTGSAIRQVLRRARPGCTPPVQAFLDHGADFVVATIGARAGRRA